MCELKRVGTGHGVFHFDRCAATAADVYLFFTSALAARWVGGHARQHAHDTGGASAAALGLH